MKWHNNNEDGWGDLECLQNSTKQEWNYVKVQPDSGGYVWWKRWVLSLKWYWDAREWERVRSSRVWLTCEIEDSEGCKVDCSREPEHGKSYFETRVDWWTLKSDNSGWTSRNVSLEVEKVVEIGRFLRLKCFVGQRERTSYWMCWSILS